MSIFLLKKSLNFRVFTLSLLHAFVYLSFNFFGVSLKAEECDFLFTDLGDVALSRTQELYECRLIGAEA